MTDADIYRCPDYDRCIITNVCGFDGNMTSDGQPSYKLCPVYHKLNAGPGGEDGGDDEAKAGDDVDSRDN